MRLKESIAEVVSRGQVPVIPFFPFPRDDQHMAGDFLQTVWTKLQPAAIGLIHPGRQPFTAVSAKGEKKKNSYEWDLFKFLFALKHQTGAPLILAVHYADVLSFGIIPYAQEGHKIGVDSLLVRDPIPEELDYFSAELAAGGVGLSLVLEGNTGPELLRQLLGYISVFAYFPQGIPPGFKNNGCGDDPFLFSQPNPDQVKRTGWILERALGPTGWKGIQGRAHRINVLEELRRMMQI